MSHQTQRIHIVRRSWRIGIDAVHNVSLGIRAHRDRIQGIRIVVGIHRLGERRCNGEVQDSRRAVIVDQNIARIEFAVSNAEIVRARELLKLVNFEPQ